MVVQSSVLLATGLAVFAVGALSWRWSARNSVNITGAALSAVITTARSGRKPTMPIELKGHLDTIKSAHSNTERARIVGGTVARHYVAKVFGWFGLIGVLLGSAMAIAGVFWK